MIISEKKKPPKLSITMRLKESKIHSQNNDLVQDSRKTNVTNIKLEGRKEYSFTNPRTLLAHNSILRGWIERFRKRTKLKHYENLSEYQINLLSDKVYLKEHKKERVYIFFYKFITKIHFINDCLPIIFK